LEDFELNYIKRLFNILGCAEIKKEVRRIKPDIEGLRWI
jgi:hypothetical protein